MEVFRRDSKKLPIGDPDVAWEETLYLNLIIHQFDYMLTLAVCTRTSPKDLQVLKRHCQVRAHLGLLKVSAANDTFLVHREFMHHPAEGEWM